jgi:branched-chain amino acid transport system substrate-binding protein
MSSGEGGFLYKMGLRRMITINSDYAWGRDCDKAQTAMFEKAGGKVVQHLFTPLGTVDFSPYLGKLDPTADVCLSSFPGADGIALLKQWKEYGLYKKTKLAGGMLCHEEMIDAAGADMAEMGLMGVLHRTSWSDYPATKRFVEIYKKEYGVRPGTIASHSYDAAIAVFSAIDAIKGNIEDTEAFCNAMRKIKFDGVGGPQGIEACTGTVYYPTKFLKVVKRDGGNKGYGHEIAGIADPAATASDMLKIMGWEPGGKAFPCKQ